jgi:hypothetical protein
MTIPKNRDNSGTPILYIVGPDFVLDLVGPTPDFSRGGT